MVNPITQVTSNKRQQLEQDLEHVTQEMYKRNVELADINKTLSLLRTIDGLVLESQDTLPVLCQNICDAVGESTDYALVSIFPKALHHKHLTFGGLNTPQKLAENIQGMIAPMMIELANPWLESLQTSVMVQMDSLADDVLAKIINSTEANVATLRQAIPAKSIYIVKLMARKGLVGVMAIGFSEPTEKLQDKDAALLQRLSAAIGIAVDSKLLLEENDMVLQALKHSNTKLKELDEAKDEFISMASHQLRTPLTSMKGYVSMVLEGDTGPINDVQRKMLDQAFVSSQRMVYLIADLLNVSRLKTGKFIIEAKPTDLSEVIEQEISQLVETAKGRELELTYEKPANFPKLMLDETKIRQVIMNFADNAIYYTPSGGHIWVGLEDKGDTVEFTVKDNGLGVPKTEQHQLFTKFFRAGNARKARPDGTGLGLFMAKKVIVAQGGAIVFHSEEGQGSTFGFSFNKAKLTPTPEELKNAAAGGPPVTKTVALTESDHQTTQTVEPTNVGVPAEPVPVGAPSAVPLPVAALPMPTPPKPQVEPATPPTSAQPTPTAPVTPPIKQFVRTTIIRPTEPAPPPKVEPDIPLVGPHRYLKD